MREEKLLYFGSEWISVVLDLPEEPPLGLVVISHGLTGDRVGPQRLLVQITEALQRAQMAVLRFDYRNAGDSSGVFLKTRFSTMNEDLHQVLAWGKERLGILPLCLIGFSIGAIPCIEILSQESVEVLMILSADLIDKPSLSHSLEEKIPFRGGAFTLSRCFFEERSQIAPRQALQESRIPRYLFYGEKDKKVKEAAASLRKFGVVPFEFKGVDHLFESYPIRLEMIDCLITLLKENFYGCTKSFNVMSDCEKREPLPSKVH